jgi:carbon starvation protein CstA
MERRIDAGAMVAALGGLLLLVSLFLAWYGGEGDDYTAWTVFELVDLVLAAVALLAISTFLRRSGVEPRMPEAPLLLLGTAALVLTASQLVNEPPAVARGDFELETGAWLALAAAAVLLAGAFMSVARVSFSVEQREPRPAAPPPAADPAPAADPETETVKLDPPDRPA